MIRALAIPGALCGLLDPGFEWRSLALAKPVRLEVRSHDVPFLIEQGQTVCRLVYEPMAERPMPFMAMLVRHRTTSRRGCVSPNISFRIDWPSAGH